MGSWCVWSWVGWVNTESAEEEQREHEGLWHGIARARPSRKHRAQEKWAAPVGMTARWSRQAEAWATVRWPM